MALSETGHLIPSTSLSLFSPLRNPRGSPRIEILRSEPPPSTLLHPQAQGAWRFCRNVSCSSICPCNSGEHAGVATSCNSQHARRVFGMIELGPSFFFLTRVPQVQYGPKTSKNSKESGTGNGTFTNDCICCIACTAQSSQRLSNSHFQCLRLGFIDDPACAVANPFMFERMQDVPSGCTEGVGCCWKISATSNIRWLISPNQPLSCQRHPGKEIWKGKFQMGPKHA